MNELTNAINQLAELTNAVQRQVAELKEAATEYAEEVHADKKNGIRTTSFSGSDEYNSINAIVRSLQGAHQQVGMIAGNLVRFAP